jgi:flagellar biosynthesis anti-sigma factor FlgM
MRIYDQNLTGAAAAESGRSAEAQKADREAGTPLTGSGSGGSGDRVELSSALASVSRALTSYQADRAGKVQSLTVQVRSGRYQPDSQATSQGMVSEALRAGAS